RKSFSPCRRTVAAAASGGTSSGASGGSSATPRPSSPSAPTSVARNQLGKRSSSRTTRPSTRHQYVAAPWRLATTATIPGVGSRPKRSARSIPPNPPILGGAVPPDPPILGGAGWGGPGLGGAVSGGPGGGVSDPRRGDS